MPNHANKQILVTGFPAYRAARLVEHLLTAEPEAQLILLVPRAEYERAQTVLADLASRVEAKWGSSVAPQQNPRVELRASEPSSIDFGLSGNAYLELAQRVHCIYHFCQVTDPSAPADVLELINIGGTREVVEFARICKRLRRLVHLSSIFVSGDRTDLVQESELAHGQAFRNLAEETLARAELLLRQAAPRLPCVVLRAGLVLGDSDSGVFGRLEGVPALFAWLLQMPEHSHVAIPNDKLTRLFVVPSDLLVKFAHFAGTCAEPAATYHVVEPGALSMQNALENAAQSLGKQLTFGLNAKLLAQNLVTTGFNPALPGGSRALAELVSGRQIYATGHFEQALGQAGLIVPTYQSYWPKLLDAVSVRLEQSELPVAGAFGWVA